MRLRTQVLLPAKVTVTSLGLALVLTGCGDRPSEPTNVGTTGGTTSTASTPAMPETIDVNNPTEVATALRALDVDTPPREEIPRDRGSGPAGDVFPTWPAGEVRLKGLSTYRIDATEKYDNSGTLKFMKGGKALFEAPFSPENERSVAAIPASVLSVLKVGDTVTWGLYAGSKSKSTVTFTIVAEKAQVTKALAKLDERHATNKLLRDLATAQVFENYGLHSEAVELYVRLHDADETLDYVWSPVVSSLRAMKRKDTPLFEYAKLHALATGPARRIATGQPNNEHRTPTPGMNRPTGVGPTNGGTAGTTGMGSSQPAGTTSSSTTGPAATGPIPGGPSNSPGDPTNGSTAPSNGPTGPTNGTAPVGQGQTPSGPPSQGPNLPGSGLPSYNPEGTAPGTPTPAPVPPGQGPQVPGSGLPSYNPEGTGPGTPTPTPVPPGQNPPTPPGNGLPSYNPEGSVPPPPTPAPVPPGQGPQLPGTGLPTGNPEGTVPPPPNPPQDPGMGEPPGPPPQDPGMGAPPAPAN